MGDGVEQLFAKAEGFEMIFYVKATDERRSLTATLRNEPTALYPIFLNIEGAFTIEGVGASFSGRTLPYRAPLLAAPYIVYKIPRIHRPLVVDAVSQCRYSSELRGLSRDEMSPVSIGGAPTEHRRYRRSIGGAGSVGGAGGVLEASTDRRR
ncbi:hypothetical protein BS47DRAFT_1483989 [Hydnum rufescens UP504]|uniref:Uncharacterized protein n=1 Tax=Hydnum rufescens UP504 TaxID=1448309 RepID=A0A9P6B351_9AGAM|nr:hypothetical protein BS47DRAFT_1483989 [Hydnum rufescens UP504]